MSRIRVLSTACGLLSSAVHAQHSPPVSPAPEELGADHARLIKALDHDSLKRGEALYTGLCLTCHGSPEQAGSLPLSRAFWKEPFKNGGDFYSLYRTLTNGLELMPAFPFLTPAEKYEVSHYVRETLVKPTNPSAYVPTTELYLERLPKPHNGSAEPAGMQKSRR